MHKAVFDPESATGTLHFPDGVRLTPVIKAVLGALNYDACSASESSHQLPFSGERTATWGAVLEHLSAQGHEMGISPSPDAQKDGPFFAWIYALADHIGARSSDIAPLLAAGHFELTEIAPVDELVALAKLLDDGHGLTSYRIEEYSVNVSDGNCVPWNPFEANFTSWHAAHDAGEQYMQNNSDCAVVIVGRVVIEDNELCGDDAELIRIERSELTLEGNPASGG